MRRLNFYPTTLFLLTSLLLSLSALGNSECASASTEDPVNTIPQPVEITADTVDIQQQLELYVDEMINLGHMAPTMYSIGLGGRPTIFYATPSETIYTLSAAYPYLSDDLKTRVKTYLDNELNLYPPHNTGYYGPNAGNFSDFAGTHREYFIQNPEQTYNFWPGINVDPSVLYALWLYAHNTNDWDYVTTHYNSLRSIYTLTKSDGNINSYPELSGVIGFARIAQHLNHTTDYNDAWNFAQTGLDAGRDFNQFLAMAQQRYPARSHEYTTQPFLFHRQESYTMVIATHFNRDIGIFLQNNAQPAVAGYTNQIEDDVNLWWLTDVGMAWGENAYATPEIAWTNFILHAYVLDTPLEELKGYLDAPTRRGDLLYIQKLVATIEVGSTASSGGSGNSGGNLFVYIPLIIKQ